MKRPLCYLAITVTAIVYIYLYFFSSDILTSNTDKNDGDYTEVVGQVADKGWRLDYFGNPSPVVYIIPSDIRNNKYKYVQCYMSDENYREPSIGENVRVCGTVKTFSPNTNPGEFDSRLYYSTLKISYRIKNARITAGDGKENFYRESLYRIRLYLEGILDKTLSAEDASIMKAILLGDKSYLADEIKEQYKLNGIFHLLVVSGTHFSLIGFGLYSLLRRVKLGNFWAMAISVAFMYSYGIMCGMGASAFRAILMFGFRILAPVVGRTYDILSALSLAEIFLLIDQPLYLYSSGFLFSFGAVIGITVLIPCLKSAYLSGRESKMIFVGEEEEKQKRITFKVWKILEGGAKSGISIALMTLPVYGLFYYTYPVHSLVLNLMVIPLMGILMTAGIICLLCGIIFIPISKIVGVFIHFILAFYKLLGSSGEVIRRFTWYMGHSETFQVIAYMALLLLFVVISKCVLEKKKKENNGYYYLALDMARLCLLTAAVCILTFRSGNGLEMDFIDVGQGDGIVVSYQGKSILIDGGSSSKKNVGKYQIIPFLKYRGIGELEAVVITHEDEDHVSGVKELFEDMGKGGIVVKKLILPEISENSRGENYKKLMEMAEELHVKILYINSGENFSLGNAEFVCLNPIRGMTSEGANAYSTVLFMKCGDFKALFTGDVEGEGQEQLKKAIARDLSEYSDVTLLKVAHHGSMYTTDKEFLDMIRPKISVISCGRDNSYGHPHKELLERLEEAGAGIYRTDLGGCIRIRVKANKMTVSEFNDV